MQPITNFTRRPDISFYPNGRIDISARIARAINLKDGDVIDIAIHGTERYIYVRLRANNVNGRHISTVHVTKRGSRNFRCYSRQLCQAMLSNAPDCHLPLRVPAGQVIQHEQYGTMMAIIFKFNIKP